MLRWSVFGLFAIFLGGYAEDAICEPDDDDSSVRSFEGLYLEFTERIFALDHYVFPKFFPDSSKWNGIKNLDSCHITSGVFQSKSGTRHRVLRFAEGTAAKITAVRRVRTRDGEGHYIAADVVLDDEESHEVRFHDCDGPFFRETEEYENARKFVRFLEENWNRWGIRVVENREQEFDLEDSSQRDPDSRHFIGLPSGLVSYSWKKEISVGAGSENGEHVELDSGLTLRVTQGSLLEMTIPSSSRFVTRWGSLLSTEDAGSEGLPVWMAVEGERELANFRLVSPRYERHLRSRSGIYNMYARSMNDYSQRRTFAEAERHVYDQLVALTQEELGIVVHEFPDNLWEAGFAQDVVSNSSDDLGPVVRNLEGLFLEFSEEIFVMDRHVVNKNFPTWLYWYGFDVGKPCHITSDVFQRLSATTRKVLRFAEGAALKIASIQEFNTDDPSNRYVRVEVELEGGEGGSVVFHRCLPLQPEEGRDFENARRFVEFLEYYWDDWGIRVVAREEHNIDLVDSIAGDPDYREFIGLPRGMVQFSFAEDLRFPAGSEDGERIGLADGLSVGLARGSLLETRVPRSALFSARWGSLLSPGEDCHAATGCDVWEYEDYDLEPHLSNIRLATHYRDSGPVSVRDIYNLFEKYINEGEERSFGDAERHVYETLVQFTHDRLGIVVHDIPEAL